MGSKKLKIFEKPLLVEFWAPLCGPCKIMEPRLTRAAVQYSDEVELLRVNADQCPDLIQKLNVIGIPTLAAFAHGSEIFRRVGLQNEQALAEVFQAAAHARKPENRLNGRGRLLRAILGLAATALGAASGPNIVILIAGGVLMFSAVYDRCPIYRAVLAKLREILEPQNIRRT